MILNASLESNDAILNVRVISIAADRRCAVAHSLETQLITRPQGSGSMTCLDADPNDLMVSPGPIPCPLPAIPTTHHRSVLL